MKLALIDFDKLVARACARSEYYSLRGASPVERHLYQRNRLLEEHIHYRTKGEKRHIRREFYSLPELEQQRRVETGYYARKHPSTSELLLLAHFVDAVTERRYTPSGPVIAIPGGPGIR